VEAALAEAFIANTGEQDFGTIQAHSRTASKVSALCSLQLHSLSPVRSWWDWLQPKRRTQPGLCQVPSSKCFGGSHCRVFNLAMSLWKLTGPDSISLVFCSLGYSLGENSSIPARTHLTKIAPRMSVSWVLIPSSTSPPAHSLLLGRMLVLLVMTVS
jgi:hypothetical protein